MLQGAKPIPPCSSAQGFQDVGRLTTATTHDRRQLATLWTNQSQSCNCPNQRERQLVSRCGEFSLVARGIAAPSHVACILLTLPEIQGMLTIDQQCCSACSACIGVCPVDALSLAQGILVIDHENCIECGACIDECPDGALSLDDRLQGVQTA